MLLRAGVSEFSRDEAWECHLLYIRLLTFRLQRRGISKSSTCLSPGAAGRAAQPAVTTKLAPPAAARRQPFCTTSDGVCPEVLQPTRRFSWTA